MRRRRLLVGLGAVCVVLWVVVAVVALRRDGGGDDDGGDEDLVAQLLSDDELALIRQAAPDPACASEPAALPSDEALVAIEIVRVDGTCLDAATEYVAEDEVDARLAELADEEGVVAAAPAPPPASANQEDDRRGDQWALDAMGVPEDSTEVPWPDGTGVVVAVLDTGVDAGHPDLGDAVVGRRRYPGEGALDVAGHGTAVAGIIAARRDNGGIVGVTPGVSILDVPVRLTDALQNPDSWRVALPWAVNHGADVVNMSLGQSRDDYDDESLKFAVAVTEFARRNEVVVVASGGNCGERDTTTNVLEDGTPIDEDCPVQDEREIPSGLPAVLSVGAVQEDRDLTGYTTRNEDIDLVAPGGGDHLHMIVTTGLGGEYDEEFIGTSAAAPHVAAAAASVRMATPDATGDDISQALIDTADPEGVSEQDRGDVGAGHGLVDLMAAVEQLRSTSEQSAENLAERTQAAYVHDGTLYAFDGDQSHPVREVGSDHDLESIVWSADHTRLVGADETTLFAWGPETELVEVPCDGCANNEIAYLDDAAVTDPGDGGRSGDLVVTLADDGTLTRRSPATLEPQGTVTLAVPGFTGEALAVLEGSAGGSLVVYVVNPGTNDPGTLYLVDPFSGEAQASHTAIGAWSGPVAVDAAGERLAYINQGPLVGGTCADTNSAVILGRDGLQPVAQPELPDLHEIDELFFNGETLYATVGRITQDADGACPTDGSAGLWRVDGDRWEQVDSTAIDNARPLEGMTGDEPSGWLVVTEDEEGFLVPRSVEDLDVGEGELGAIDIGYYSEGLWATPTVTEVPRGEGDGGGEDDGGSTTTTRTEPPSEGVEGAIARYEEFLHALGEEDIDTVCEIAGPAAQIAEDEGFGPCEQTFGLVFDMISEEQHAALREATIDPAQVEESDDGEVFIPVEAIVADVTFTEEDLGSTTLRFQNGDWFIVE